MTLAVAVQMDPIESVDIDADSTLRFAWRRRRGAMRCSTTCPMRSCSATAG